MTNTEIELSHKLAIAKLIKTKMDLILDLRDFESYANPDDDMIQAMEETRAMIAEMTEVIARSSSYVLA